MNPISRLTVFMSICGTLCFASGEEQVSADSIIAEGIQTFNRAYDAWSREGFEKSRELFHRAAKLRPDDVAAYYWEGVAGFHLVNHTLFGVAEQRDRDAGKEYIDDALGALNQALRVDDNHAESHALYGTLLGITIYLNPLRAVTAGPKVFDHLERATELAPRNPRVYYLVGTSYGFTPKAFGGGVDKGIYYLEKAVENYKLEQQKEAEPLEPRWGYSTTLAFLARSHERKGNEQKAEAYYRQALEQNPKDKIALDGLEQLES